MKMKRFVLEIILAFSLALGACTGDLPESLQATETANESTIETAENSTEQEDIITVDNWYRNLSTYAGSASIPINNGKPFFTKEEITQDAFEEYSELDTLGRCGVAFANICREIMPTEDRGNIGSIQPSGWHTVKYDVIADRYLYNRCHLIGYQLAGENANEKNLITGTRYLNVEGMLPWENLVAAYVEETGGHVLYRVTPYFEEDNLVASGVRMEAYSVEDSGAGICFHVYCYNVQPGIIIDYATGESHLDESWSNEETESQDPEYDYVLNTNTKRFHDPACASVTDISDKNREYFTGSRESLIEDGYVPCGRCKP